MIAYAVNLQKSLCFVCLAEFGKRQNNIGCDFRGIPVRLFKAENFRPGRRLPAVYFRIALTSSTAMIIVFDPALLQNFRYIRTVTKGVRLKVHFQAICVHVKEPGQIPLGIQDVTSHRL